MVIIMDELSELVRIKEDPYRYAHTLSVAAECDRLSSIFGLDETDTQRLHTAALLHDITKGLSTEQQIMMCKKQGIMLCDDDLNAPATIHALTGAAQAASEYRGYTDSEICAAIRTHTTGAAEMTLMQKLLYLADFIEPTRKYDDCRQLREYFYSMLNVRDCREALELTLLRSYEMTITLLNNKDAVIHSMTLDAYRSALERTDKIRKDTTI